MQNQNTRLTAFDFPIGTEVETSEINLGGLRRVYRGTVVDRAGRHVVVRWDGNEMGATESILPGRLRRIRVPLWGAS